MWAKGDRDKEGERGQCSLIVFDYFLRYVQTYWVIITKIARIFAKSYESPSSPGPPPSQGVLVQPVRQLHVRGRAEDVWGQEAAGTDGAAAAGEVGVAAVARVGARGVERAHVHHRAQAVVRVLQLLIGISKCAKLVL